MKKLPTLETRNRERGAVAMLVAVMWTALFGMAVLAIDFGYLYTKRRNLQAVADAAVRSAMPVFDANNPSAANNRAYGVTRANLFDDSKVTPSLPGGNRFRVTIQTTYPTFFGSLFGLGSKQVTGQATGLKNVLGVAPAIYSGGAGCNPAAYSGPSPGAVVVNGAGQLVVNGDIATQADKVELASWGGGCSVAGTCKVTGTVNSPCAVIPDTAPPDLTIAGTGTAVTADPLLSLGALGGFCTVGNLGAALPGLTWLWNGAGNCYMLDPPNQVYCSNANIQVTPPANGSICATGSFISTAGVTVQTDGAVNLTASTLAPPAPAAGSRLLAFAGGPGDGTCNTASMWITAGALVTTFTLNGTLYAPTGCIHIGSDALTFNSNGLIDGKMVFIEMGTGKTWTFNGPGGVAGPAWTMVD